MPEEKEKRLCGCGCGGTPKGGQYLPGHDARHKAAVFRAARLGDPVAKATITRKGWSTYTLTDYRETLRELSGRVVAFQKEDTAETRKAMRKSAKNAIAMLPAPKAKKAPKPKAKAKAKAKAKPKTKPKPESEPEPEPDPPSKIVLISASKMPLLDPRTALPVEIGGTVYPTPLHAYYSTMLDDPDHKKSVSDTKTTGWLKRKFGDIEPKEGWAPYGGMLFVLFQVMIQHPDARAQLLSIPAGTEKILWLNDDPVLGHANSKGENVVGRALLETRQDVDANAPEPVEHTKPEPLLISTSRDADPDEVIEDPVYEDIVDGPNLDEVEF